MLSTHSCGSELKSLKDMPCMNESGGLIFRWTFCHHQPSLSPIVCPLFITNRLISNITKGYNVQLFSYSGDLCKHSGPIGPLPYIILCMQIFVSDQEAGSGRLHLQASRLWLEKHWSMAVNISEGIQSDRQRQPWLWIINCYYHRERIWGQLLSLSFVSLYRSCLWGPPFRVSGVWVLFSSIGLLSIVNLISFENAPQPKIIGSAVRGEDLKCYRHRDESSGSGKWSFFISRFIGRGRGHF